MTATDTRDGADAPVGAAAPADADALVAEHLDLADRLAGRFARGARDRDDLVQIARLGLVKAARRYDPAAGVPFVGFAIPTVTGELKRALRDTGWVVRPPRAIQELHHTIAARSGTWAQELGREPTVEDISSLLDVPPEDAAAAVASADCLQPASLDAELDGRSLADVLPAPLSGYGIDEKLDLRAAMAQLDATQRRILRLRYVEEMSQQRIGELVGLSQVQVSRVLSRTLVRLHELLVAPRA